ncbi:hypothetical protein OA93_04820 [Flavobacterium sp. KMS]|uniref:SH3 domain-containing protein n=1 Tax=Flavobacterium sp. KMS TaxID=1566023 RepID=UPI00057C6C2A|nr:SH3 domain-containing protein [Flavobacterium sp. KMS]KIA99492.1 hypothetical protein OA93_04820 [Flavobacterium sp. KMS]
MKIIKLLLILNLFFISSITKAQLAIVYDKDGYVNVREKPDLKSKITGKIIEGQVFCINTFDDERNNPEWLKIWYPINPDSKIKDFTKFRDIKEDGYIHKSRVFYLENLKEISFKNESSKKISVKNDTLQIYIESKPFEKEKHQIIKDNGGGLIIDKDAFYWGFLGQIPRNELKAIKVVTNNSSYSFPKEAISGLYELNLEFTKLYIGNKNEIYINLSGADGSDSYEVVWCLKNNKIYSMTIMQIIP